MQTICIFLGVIVSCFAATTHRPPHTTHAHTNHTTHAHTNLPIEPWEIHTIIFQFQPLTFHLLAMTPTDRATKTSKCFIATISDSEHAQIHTDAGMRAVELRILAALGSATAVTDVSTLDTRDVTTCTSHTIFLPLLRYFTITV
ncbi:uncharacterized protein LOC127841221 [Dreissena polymorpha]|uniref:Uncharacterized protein n=1 Tax=Dreissena polymorpha TaxID=45954 RepID=A0A9D4EZ40_DREPO|nr:uncharacterized protein LOC127841221 [Dreissena polymorpha]KAH3788431.1 hypothetical protein DPMN_166575 [Dreissena polymorpha]